MSLIKSSRVSEQKKKWLYFDIFHHLFLKTPKQLMTDSGIISKVLTGVNFAKSVGIKVNRKKSNRILNRGLEFHGLWPQNSLKICQNRFLEWHFFKENRLLYCDRSGSKFRVKLVEVYSVC